MPDPQFMCYIAVGASCSFAALLQATHFPLCSSCVCCLQKTSSLSVPAVRLAIMKQSPGGNQAHSLKTAGTSDMLAWLDAKIAAQKASILG